MNDCKTCQMVAQRDAGTAPLWDNIYRTDYWDVVHSYNSALLGWIVLVPREHHTAVADLSAAEAAELGLLLQRVSKALAELTGCVKTYVMQFAEHPLHPHVHFHVVPRMAGQPAEQRSYRVLNLLGVPEEEQVSEEEMNDISLRLREILNAR
jgi:diadenosine tetraphosphate (Ap4A) HIT family hydrolase